MFSFQSTNRFHGIFEESCGDSSCFPMLFFSIKSGKSNCYLQVLQDQGEDEVEEVDGKEDVEDVEDVEDMEDEDATQTAEDSKKKKKRKSEAEDNKDSAAAGDWELPSISRTLRGSDRG